MRLLVDECLSPQLVTVAQQEGFEAYHVVYRGWRGVKDHVLFARAASENFTFVTNNRRDFIGLADRADLHAGLIILLPEARLGRRIELFRIALSHAASRPSMVNTVIEIGDDGVPHAYEMPAAPGLPAGAGGAGPGA